jgi:hypothetical protein
MAESASRISIALFLGFLSLRQEEQTPETPASADSHMLLDSHNFIVG